VDWRRIVFTDHMTEAARVVGECQVVLDFGAERVAYELKVYEALKGDGEPFFAIGTNPEDPQGYRPVGSAASAEDALQACLNAAGIHHRRRVKQSGE
jgi:hypothetical protein